MGYKLDAKKNSEETHRLPLPPNAMGERNWPNLLKQIFAFIDGSPTQVPALYTDENQIPIITSFLKTFCIEANEETEFRIYPLQNLFYALKQESCKYCLEEDNGFVSIHIANAILQRDEYDYRSGIACDVRYCYFNLILTSLICLGNLLSKLSKCTTLQWYLVPFFFLRQPFLSKEISYRVNVDEYGFVSNLCLLYRLPNNMYVLDAHPLKDP